MKELVKGNLYYFFRSRYSVFYYIFGLFSVPLVYILFFVLDLIFKTYAYYTASINVLPLFIIYLLFFSGITFPMTLKNSYSEGTIKNLIISGHSRKNIVYSSFITSLILIGISFVNFLTVKISFDSTLFLNNEISNRTILYEINVIGFALIGATIISFLSTLMCCSKFDTVGGAVTFGSFSVISCFCFSIMFFLSFAYILKVPTEALDVAMLILTSIGCTNPIGQFIYLIVEGSSLFSSMSRYYSFLFPSLITDGILISLIFILTPKLSAQKEIK